MRDDFDKDRAKFCRDVQNGECDITHEDWPSFLYPETGYNPDNLDKGLLRGPFLLSVSRSIVCICIANLSIVLPTCVYRTTHRYEANQGKDSEEEMSCGYFRHDGGNSRDNRIYCSTSELPFHFITRMFLIDVSSAVTSSTQRGRGVHRMVTLTPRPSLRISWSYSKTKIGPRKL